MAREDVLRVRLVADGAGQVKAEMLGVEQGMGRLDDRAQRTSKTLGAMKAALAGISVAAIAAAFKSVVDGADAMGKLAQATGTTVEQISGLSYAAKLSDVEVEALSGSLIKLSKNAHDMANGTGEARLAFEAMGLSVKDSDGRLKGTGDLLGEVADKLSSMEDGSQKTALAVKIFGEQGAKLIPFLNQGSAGIAALSDEAAQLGLVFDKELSANSEQLNDDMTRLGAALRGVLIQSMRDIIPVVSDIVTAFVDWVKHSESVDVAAKILGGTFKVLVQAGSIVGTVFEQLGTLIGGVAAALVTAVQGDFAGAAAILKQAFKDMDKAAQDNWAFIDKLWGRAKDGPKAATPPTNAYNNTLKDTSVEAKKAEKALEALEKKRAAARDSIEDQIDALVLEQYQLTLSAREREIFKELLKAENTARAAGIDLTDEQREAIERETAVLYDQNAAIKAREEAEKAATKAAEDAAKEREKLAEQEAEAMRRPFEHAAEGIQDAFTSAFENIFSGNVRSFSDMADEIKRVFVRLAAEIATLLVFNPQASFGQVTGGVFGRGPAATGAQLANPGGGFSMPGTPGLSSLAQAGGGFGGAFMGAGLGALYGYQQGGTRGAVVGGLAGYAGGAALTTGAAALGAGWGAGAAGGAALAGAGSALAAIPVWGWVALAALAIFGGGKKKPSDKAAWGNLDLSSGNTFGVGGFTGKKYSQETVDARDAYLDALREVTQAVTTITGGRLTGSSGINIGLRDGTRVSGHYAPGTYADPQAALRAVVQSMLTNLQGVDQQFRTVFQRLDLSDLEKAVNDINFAAFIINKKYVQEAPLNAAEQAIKDLNDAFKPLLENAQRLGLSLRPINDELSRQMRQLRTGFSESIADAILAIVDPLALALKQHEAVAKERVANARALGVSLVEVERLNALERQRIIEQVGGETQTAERAFREGISNFLRDLRSGPGSFLSGDQVLANAETDFNTLLAEARAGDAFARTNLTSAASNLITASRNAFGSTEQFQQRLQFIERTLENVASPGFGDYRDLGLTISQGNTAVVHELQTLNQRVVELTRTVATQQAALDRMLQA